MQELCETQTPRDPQFHHQRPYPFVPIEIVILRRINQIKPCNPANYACREHNRSKIDPTSLRDPCTDRCNGQREAEKEVRCARESFCDGIEKNQSQRNRRKNESQSIDGSRRKEKATTTDCKQHDCSWH